MERALDILNQILTGEYMAIQKYQSYIDSMADSPLRNHLIAMVSDHKNNATRLAYFIQTNGGYVEEGTGVAGFLSSLDSGLKKLSENTPIKMIDELHIGESRGLDKILQLMRDLSASEKETVQAIVSDSQEHLTQLERLKEDLLQ